MSCRDFEYLIALHVEGDGSESERQRVESHLRTCSNCWDLAEDLKESQAVFKSIRENVPNQAMLSAVRARVLDDVARMESGTWFERLFLPGFRQKATLAGMALMVVGGGALLLVREQAIPIPPPVRIGPPVVPEPLAPTVSHAPAPKLRVRRQMPAPVPQDTVREQVTIKLLTDDPNIIIYWLVDEKGD